MMHADKRRRFRRSQPVEVLEEMGEEQLSVELRKIADEEAKKAIEEFERRADAKRRTRPPR